MVQFRIILIGINTDDLILIKIEWIRFIEIIGFQLFDNKSLILFYQSLILVLVEQNQKY